MKKVFSFIALILIGFFTLTSCVGKTEGPHNQGGGDNPNVPVDPNVPNDDLITYTVSLYRNGSLWIPNMDIKAIFVNDVSVSEVTIDDFYGIATFKGDGDYNVHLSAVPKGYTYNPNIYSVDPQHTDLIIDLVPLLSFESGNGRDPYVSPYVISRMGYYSVELESANDRRYFTFLPTSSGEYSVESLSDIYDDDVDPDGIWYTGSEQYINEEYGSERHNDGGVSLDTGYTSNFKFSVTFAASELNVARVFAIEAESKQDIYPCTVYFKIEYVGEFSLGDGFNPTVLVPQEANSSVTPLKTGSLHWLTDLNGGVLDVRNYRLNEADGFWHVYDEELYKETDGLGPTLVCPVNLVSSYLGNYSYGATNPKILGSGFFDEAVSHQPAYFCLTTDDDERVCYDYFLQGNGPLYGEDGNPLVYTGEYYLKYANEDGMVYVTNELMEFWQLLANNHQFFYDGEGLLEQSHISSGQDDQWLFACAYYA